MKHIYTKNMVLGILSILVLSACSGPRDASNENFTLAINQYLDKKNPTCYIVAADSLPISLRNDGQSSNGSKAQMDALTAAGIVNTEKIVIEPLYAGVADESLKADDDSKKAHPGLKYSLTPLGEKNYQMSLPPSEDWPKGGAGFCFGTAEVASIKEYSTPEIGEGGTVSLVKFTYKVKQAATWIAKTPALSVAFPEYAKVQAGEAMMELKLKRGVENWEVLP